MSNVISLSSALARRQPSLLPYTALVRTLDASAELAGELLEITEQGACVRLDEPVRLNPRTYVFFLWRTPEMGEFEQAKARVLGMSAEGLLELELCEPMIDARSPVLEAHAAAPAAPNSLVAKALLEPLPGGKPRTVAVSAPIIGEREIAYVTDAVRSGWVSSTGPYINRFEEEFARFIGVKHAISVSNGTVALHLALHALGIGPGDEVIVPDLTFAATAHTVLQVGATPVLVDVEPDTWCLDPRATERALSSKTKAIIPVHLFGHPADMHAILALARRHHLHVIEDAAEAHGATFGGRKVGSLGNIGAYSFYGNKVMTTGEGGMVTTNDDDLAHRCRFLKNHGMTPERRYYHTELAFNYRMTNLQAALGLAQVEQVHGFIEKKRQIMAWYREALDGVPWITLNTERPGCRSVYWMVSVVLDERAPVSRDEVCSRLKEQGVETRPFFIPMSDLPHLAALRQVAASGDRCVESRRLSALGLNLPSGCGLARDDVYYSAEALVKGLTT